MQPVGIPFSYETPLVLVLNSKSAAGIKFNQNGYLNDGNLDVIIFLHINQTHLYHYLIEL